MGFSSFSWWLVMAAGAAQAQEVPALLALPNSAAHLDPSRPLRIGEEFYPPESLKLREEGRCVVQVNVDRTGEMHDPKIIISSGHERLDAACLEASAAGHLIPAMQDGIAVDSVAKIPIVWSLKKLATLAECMALPESRSWEQAAATPPPLEERRKNGVRVVVRVFVSDTGLVEGAKIDQSSGSKRLDEAALKGVNGQKMDPATANGVPIPACVTLPVVWKLQ